MYPKYIWQYGTHTWSEAAWTWGDLYRPGSPGDTSESYSWLEGSDKKDVSEQIENRIKIFITVHNQFLTERQRKIFKIAKVYPSYEEQFEIEKQEKVFLKEYKLEHKIDLKAKIDIEYVKLGLQKIEENVKTRNRK